MTKLGRFSTTPSRGFRLPEIGKTRARRSFISTSKRSSKLPRATLTPRNARWSRQLDVLANCNLTLIPCGASQNSQAHVHLLTGDLETGLRWAAQREFPHEEPISYLNERAAITRTWIDLERDETDSAERLIRRLIANLTRIGRSYRRATAQLMLAAVCLRTGRR